MNTNRHEYVTVNLRLEALMIMANEKVSIPNGNVVAMGAVVAGNLENKIINLSVLDNNNEVVRPCDVRFSEKTNAGTFQESMRPVQFIGGKSFDVRLVALEEIAELEFVTVQVLFMVETTSNY